MMNPLTPVSLLRSAVAAVILAVVIHYLAEYFEWHVFTEAGGFVARVG
jgi:hypothetical protein